MTVESIMLSNDLKELQRLGAFLQDVSRTLQLDEMTLYRVNLVCDELVTNIILYGYPEDVLVDQAIRIDIEVVSNGWELRLTDRGIAFNPLLRSAPSIDLSVDERSIGGLGIHFVRQVMDDIRYERLNNENVLMMVKRRVQEEGIL
ncbi:ATP-binding protein [Paenibacillus sp. HWE-109]|uniref:ATP-binding protein n=1 Tax=Paenibacillus sp. HWE-109 TaxID=1306526 RepID=UPI001EDDF9CB|nr:ATP-binding protein [Paenibacillus sp. HWE-109]UKS25235.1 ATP-binding protein [Paenibacillus sp. HWE-109]